MKLMIDDIESIRRHLQIEKWSVLGHSFGGMLASYYAAQHPDRIEKMILSSSGGIDLELLNYVSESINSKLTKEQLNGVNYWANRISQGDTSHHARLERGKNLAHAYVIDKKFLPAIAERLTQGNQTVNILIWTSMQSIGFNCAEGLEKFNKPVLIIQGKQDIIKAETAEKAHRVLKNSKLVYLENCIHYGWLDCEKSYLEEIENLLDTEKR
jgi:proline iminopeptidase